jgi:Uma2 family endonuclease
MVRMRAVLVDADLELQRRRKLGLDKRDELWDGLWHLVNAPKLWHERLNVDMVLLLGPRARELGLEPYAGAGVMADVERNFRIPDQVYARPDQLIDDGVTSAELVVEVRSPGDESYLKLPFYAEQGVTEVLIVHQDRRFELYRLDGAGVYRSVDSGRSQALAATFTTVDGPKMRITWEGRSADV